MGEVRPLNRKLPDYGTSDGRYPTTLAPDHGRKPSTFEPLGGRDSTILELTPKTVVEKLPSQSVAVVGFLPLGLPLPGVVAGIGLRASLRGTIISHRDDSGHKKLAINPERCVCHESKC